MWTADDKGRKKVSLTLITGAGSWTARLVVKMWRCIAKWFCGRQHLLWTFLFLLAIGTVICFLINLYKSIVGQAKG